MIVFSQHDAHEFFIDLMNSMHEELVMRLGLYLQVRSLPKQLPSTPLSTSGRSQIISEKELDSMNTTTETLDESTENEEIKVEDYGMYIPTQRQFFSDVRTSFSCIHCGYAREAINVRKSHTMLQHSVTLTLPCISIACKFSRLLLM